MYAGVSFWGREVDFLSLIFFFPRYTGANQVQNASLTYFEDNMHKGNRVTLILP